jgi:hypothetical protein
MSLLSSPIREDRNDIAFWCSDQGIFSKGEFYAIKFSFEQGRVYYWFSKGGGWFIAAKS